MQNITDWLCKLGLEQYVDLFVRNGIDAEVLPDLTDRDLEQLGVLLGHRRKILRAIIQLNDTAERPVAAPESDAERRHLTVMFCERVTVVHVRPRPAVPV